MTNTSALVGAPLLSTMTRLAVPGVIGALLFSTLGLIEASFLRHTGTDALAAIALVFPLIILCAMFSAGAIGGAVSGRTARAIGAGDENEASSILVCAVFISLLGGLLSWILVVQFGPNLYAYATNSETVQQAAQQYAAMLFPAITAFWLLNMLCSVLRGGGDMVRPAVVAAVMLVAYFVLASATIPTETNDLQATIQAAALSMVGAYLLSLLAALFFIAQKRQPIRFRLSAFRWQTLRSILRQGLVASSQSVMTVTYALVTTALFSRFGTDWLAGYGLAVRLELIMVPIIFGIGASLIAIVGAYVGAGQREKAISIAWRGIWINAALIGVLGLLLSLFPTLWCGVVGSDATVIAHCSQSLKIIAPTYAFFALGLGGYFASQGLDTLKYPVLGSLLRLATVSSGLLWVASTSSVESVLYLTAFAVVLYGVFVIAMLKFRAWR